MMIKVLSILLVFSMLLTACLKSDGPATCPYDSNFRTAPQTEQEALAEHLDTSGLEATKHATGLYYQILDAGTGTAEVKQCSQILVNYTGWLANGTQFEKTDNAHFVLGAMIEGWRIGIPLVKKGGRLKLYIPPTLAYGNNDMKDNNGNIVIPRNSILVFEVTLSDHD